MGDERTLLETVPEPVRGLWERYYPEPVPPRFEEKVARNIHSNCNVLEIGAGSGRDQQKHFDLKGKVARYVGVDPDESVLTNPYLDESFVAKAELLPFADESFDLVFHHYVAEHFEFPPRAIAKLQKS